MCSEPGQPARPGAQGGAYRMVLAVYKEQVPFPNKYYSDWEDRVADSAAEVQRLREALRQAEWGGTAAGAGAGAGQAIAGAIMDALPAGYWLVAAAVPISFIAVQLANVEVAKRRKRLGVRRRRALGPPPRTRAIRG